MKHTDMRRTYLRSKEKTELLKGGVVSCTVTKRTALVRPSKADGFSTDFSQSDLERCTVQPFIESDDTRCCVNTICPPEDERVSARNMSRIVV